MTPGLEPTAGHLLHVLATIALTFVMGIEREEKAYADKTYTPAGVRTFPIVGLLGYTLALLAQGNALPIALGFAGLVALLVTSFWHRLKDGDHGFTGEMAILAAYMVGALVASDLLWLATAVSVGIVLLLQARVPLRTFATHLPREEVATFTIFLLLTAVILPVLPNEEFTDFRLNPFRTWLIVVAVSAISYVSYILQRLIKVRQTTLFAALLGGVYSSTVVTVVLSRRSKLVNDPRLYAGAILMACGVMYVRTAILLWIFNATLGLLIGPRLIVLALLALVSGYLVATWRRATQPPGPGGEPSHRGNPLEMGTAFLFAGLFLAITVIVQLTVDYVGASGVYALGALAGTVQLDAFSLSLTQTAGREVPLAVAATGVLIATISNNVVKAGYAMVFGEKQMGKLTLLLMALLSLTSLLALINL